MNNKLASIVHFLKRNNLNAEASEVEALFLKKTAYWWIVDAGLKIGTWAWRLSRVKKAVVIATPVAAYVAHREQEQQSLNAYSEEVIKDNYPKTDEELFELFMEWFEGFDMGGWFGEEIPVEQIQTPMSPLFSVHTTWREWWKIYWDENRAPTESEFEQFYCRKKYGPQKSDCPMLWDEDLPPIFFGYSLIARPNLESNLKKDADEIIFEAEKAQQVAEECKPILDAAKQGGANPYKDLAEDLSRKSSAFDDAIDNLQEYAPFNPNGPQLTRTALHKSSKEIKRLSSEMEELCKKLAEAAKEEEAARKELQELPPPEGATDVGPSEEERKRKEEEELNEKYRRMGW